MLRKPASVIEKAILKRIGGSPDGILIKRLLQKNLEEADIANRVLEGNNLARSQGSALTLQAILKLLEA